MKMVLPNLKNYSGTAQGARQRAKGTDLAYKLPKNQMSTHRMQQNIHDPTESPPSNP